MVSSSTIDMLCNNSSQKSAEEVAETTNIDMIREEVLLRDQIKKEIMRLPGDLQVAALQAEEQRKAEWKRNRQRRLALHGRPNSTLSSANSSQSSTPPRSATPPRSSTPPGSSSAKFATPLVNTNGGTAQTPPAERIGGTAAQPTIRVSKVRRIGNRMSSLFGK